MKSKACLPTTWRMSTNTPRQTRSWARRDSASGRSHSCSRSRRGGATTTRRLPISTTEPVESLGFATIDHHRALRQAIPRSCSAPGKTPAQAVEIATRSRTAGDGFLVTRADAARRSALSARFPAARVTPLAGTVHFAGRATLYRRGARSSWSRRGRAIVGGRRGRGDRARARIHVGRATDVGVAGIHRIVAHHEALRDADVVIVVAGMDGALPSVVGGLVAVPVIAVPTSVGYGASFGGVAACSRCSTVAPPE